jgi:hypothetical protein
MAVRHRDAAGALSQAARWLGGAVLLLAACRPEPSLQAYWTGTDTGKAVLPARAALCGPHGPLLVFGQSGDTGIGLALYPLDSLQTGKYPVFDPTLGVVRPGAAVAARWTRKMVMADLRGTQGQVALEQAGPAVSGHFSARTNGVVQSGAVAMEGSFRGIPLARGGPDCTGRPR